MPIESPIDAQLFEIGQQLAEIRAELNFIRDTIVKADTTISTVASQVMPTVNDLMKSPLLKMLGMKK